MSSPSISSSHPTTILLFKKIRTDLAKQHKNIAAAHQKKSTQTKTKTKVEKVTPENLSICKKITQFPLFSYYTNPILKAERLYSQQRQPDSNVFLLTRKHHPNTPSQNTPSLQTHLHIFEFDTTRHRFATWLHTLKTLARNLEWCNQHNICFFNIHPDKIVLDAHGVPLLHDFSESFIKTPTPLQHYHWTMPFECFVLFTMEQQEQHSLSKSNIEDMCKTFVLRHPIITESAVSKERIKRQYVDAVQTLLPWLNRSRRDMELFFYSTCGTWDVYSLSMMYLDNLNQNYAQRTKDPFYDECTKMFFEAIHPDATQRPTWPAFLSSLDSLVKFIPRTLPACIVDK